MSYDVAVQRIGKLGVEEYFACELAVTLPRTRAHRIRLLRREENLRVNRLETSRPNFFSFGNLVEGPFRFIVGPE